MRLSLHDEREAMQRQCRPGAQRLHAYARLVGQLERLRDQASLHEVRHSLNGALHRVYMQAQKERARR
jgi:hypothetical protein